MQGLAISKLIPWKSLIFLVAGLALLVFLICQQGAGRIGSQIISVGPVFLAVIGAICDVSAVGNIGPLGVRLLLFVSIVVVVHGLITFALGALFRIDPDIVAVASQANIGGGTSALALARSLGRPDLVIPAVLAGSFGVCLGTYLGFLTAARLP